MNINFDFSLIFSTFFLDYFYHLPYASLILTIKTEAIFPPSLFYENLKHKMLKELYGIFITLIL